MWNDRHHVLHAAANEQFHESDKALPEKARAFKPQVSRCKMMPDVKRWNF